MNGSLQTTKQNGMEIKEKQLEKNCGYGNRQRRDNISINVFFLKKNTKKLENIQRFIF